MYCLNTQPLKTKATPVPHSIVSQDIETLQFMSLLYRQGLDVTVSKSDTRDT